VTRFAADGGLVLGICNGFQILCEAGLLPGVLRPNASLSFICRDVALRVEAMTHDDGLGVLAITHYASLLAELQADRIHVLMGGRIVASGGPELADQLEQSGYEGLAAQLGVDELSVEKPEEVDPFSDPGFEAHSKRNPVVGPHVVLA